MRRPRRTFCSQICVDALLVRTSPSAARDRVFERDRGVCARCGLDTQALKRKLAGMRRRNPVPESLDAARRLSSGFERAVTLRARRPWIAIRRALWEADHVVPVVEGGGGCGLENLRTLCIPCHRAQTRDLARRRAAARRTAGRTEPGAERPTGARRPRPSAVN
ncbi:MAG: HNH endonuclease [Acidobacteriota bacterium]